MISAYAYARFSSANQNETSIEAQTEAIESFARAQGYQILGTYVDREQSAARMIQTRPEFDRMRRDIEAGINNIKALIVYKYDRLFRNMLGALDFERFLDVRNIQLISVTENTPTRREDGRVDPSGLLSRRIHFVFAETSSLMTSERTTDSMFSIARKHQAHLAGTPPYGYKLALSDPEDWNSLKVLQVVPHEADNVRLIFELARDGKTYGEIIKALNERGARTKTGKPFAPNSLTSILRNERYVGTYLYGVRRMNRLTSKQRTMNPNPVRVENGVPAIVSKELWDEVQAMIVGRKHAISEETKVAYMLTGLIDCGVCGYAMVGQSSASRASLYRCGNRRDCTRWQAGKIGVELSVAAAMFERYYKGQTPEKIYGDLCIIQEAIDRDRGSEIHSAHTELNTVESKLSNLIDSLAEGVAVAKIKDRIRDLETRQAELEKRIAELKDGKGYRVAVSLEDVRTKLEEQLHAFEVFDITILRRIAVRYVARISVWPDRLRILWKDGAETVIENYTPPHPVRGILRKRGVDGFLISVGGMEKFAESLILKGNMTGTEVTRSTSGPAGTAKITALLGVSNLFK